MKVLSKARPALKYVSKAPARLANAIVFNAIASLPIGSFLGPYPIVNSSEDPESTKKWVKVSVAIILMLIVGAVAASVAGGIGLYILGVFNNTNVKIPASYNFLSPLVPTVGSLFTILGVAILIIILVVLVLKVLLKSSEEL